MKVHGIEIPEAAIEAGRLVMRRARFTATDTERAIVKHIIDPQAHAGWSKHMLAREAAARLHQAGRKAGRVRYRRETLTWSKVVRLEVST